MELPQAISCGVYRTAERATQRIPCRWIAFTVSGLRAGITRYPDGTVIPWNPGDAAHLSLGYPGSISEFEYGSDRENWVLMLDFPALRYDSLQHRLYLENGESRIALETCRIVPDTEIPEMRDRFRRIAELAGGALPESNLKADLLAAELIAEFMPDPAGDGGAAENLRKRLDADRAWTATVERHCRAEGKVPDVLRRAFQQRYGIAPYAYRDRLRRNDILSLVTYSSLTFKEIADELGIRHVQHFNLLVKKYFNCTPGELRKRYRKTPVFVASSRIGE